MKRIKEFDCSQCGSMGCHRRDAGFPASCLTTGVARDEVGEVVDEYRKKKDVARMMTAAAEIEGVFYGKLTRVEEIIAFSKKIGAGRIGVATCIGLMAETRTFVRILAAKGLESFSVICKVGSIDKTEVGVPEEFKLRKGSYEACCNPILQARILNRRKTGLNVIVGLCVGHDAMFSRYSKAPVTTLIAKDRILGHNPAAALYTSGFYYQRLLSGDPD